MSDEQLRADFSRLESVLETVYAPIAESIRRLIDVSIRTEADPATVTAAKAKIDGAVDELSASLRPGSFGVQRTPDGRTIALGNAVIGLRNPVAPPLVINHEPDGLVWSEFVLGAAYEGPSEHVHGGVSALVLDHVLGAAASLVRPVYTGTLTLRYRRRTALGRRLRAEARIERVEGVKTFAVGHLADDDGVTVEAEGIFIRPRQISPS